MWPFRRATAPPTPIPEQAPPAKRVSFLALDNARVTRPGPVTPFQMPQLAPGVRPAGMAMDEVGVSFGQMFSWAAQNAMGSEVGFLGYATLAELAQRPEYRRATEIIAEEMTRHWIVLTGTGDDDKSDRIAELEAEMKRMDVRGVFREALELDGYFGRGQIYLDTGATDDPDELRRPMPLKASKIGRGGLKAIRAVDPTWTSPQNYNSRDPLKPDYFQPQTWYVMGKEIHSTRLLTVMSRPVPDMLKPAYNFSGLSLTQLMLPYVQNWIRTRQSVSDLIHAFTTFVISTNLEGLLAGGDGSGEAKRLELFNLYRDNRGLMVVDKESETLENVSAPLSTLDALQAQSQEQMASVTGIPLVKLLGITPSGLNASSDGEVRVFYDHVLALQEKTLSAPLRTVIHATMISLWGAIDDDIDFAFEPLWQLDETQKAAIRQSDATVDQTYVDMGAISPEEVRQRIADHDESQYPGLDPDDMPDPPELDDGGGEAGGIAPKTIGAGGLKQQATTKAPAGAIKA